MELTVNAVDVAWRLFGAGRFEEASESAHAVVKTDPDNVSALCCAAVADWEAGRNIEASLSKLRRAAELAPRNSAVWHNLATLEASNGDMDAAAAGFLQALEINPADTRAFFSLTQNQRIAEETPLVQRMLNLYGSGSLDRAALEFLCFGLAKAYADLGVPSRAMHFCIEANWLADRPWDRAREEAKLDAIRHFVARGGFTRGKRSPVGPAPMFIVGMPRSGTTLVEAILSRHPAVHAIGETTFMSILDRQLTGDDPRRLPGLLADKVRVAGEQTLKQMQQGAQAGARYIADKTPENAFRVALIAAIFPNAHIIHVRRHPLDCGLSNLFTRFNAGQGFAFRQTDLGKRILQTAEVMKLWRQADLLPILDVSYEQLVADPRGQAGRMLDFLDLPWDENCLTPEQAKHSVRTASQYQVRQKINSGSVGRHEAYREWLGPLIETLGGNDWIEAEFLDQQLASNV